MKNTIKVFGIIALAMLFALVSCGDGSGDGGDDPADGLTITGLGDFEGKYVVALGEVGPLKMGAYAELTDMSPPDNLILTGAIVSGGTVTLHVGTATDAMDIVTPYSGSDKNVKMEVYINPTAGFSMADGEIGGETAVFFEGSAYIDFTNGSGSGVFVPKGSAGGPGGLTLTGLGDFEGKYVVALGEVGPLKMGAYAELTEMSPPNNLMLTGAIVSGGAVTLHVGTATADMDIVTPYSGSDKNVKMEVYINPTGSSFSMAAGEIGGETAAFLEGSAFIDFTNGAGSGVFVPKGGEHKLIAPEWRQPFIEGEFQDIEGMLHSIIALTLGANTITISAYDLDPPVILSNVYTEGGGPVTVNTPGEWAYVYQDSAKIGYIFSFTGEGNHYYRLLLGDKAKYDAEANGDAIGVTFDLTGVPDCPSLAVEIVL